MAPLELPTHDQLAEVVGLLVGQTTVVESSPDAGAPSHAGLLLRRDDSVVAVVVIDLAGVVGVGGAMLLLPGAMGVEAIAQGRPTNLQVEAFRAVLTAIALACNPSGRREEHVHLGDLIPIAELGDAERLLVDSQAPTHRLAFEVEGHPRGVMTFSEAA